MMIIEVKTEDMFENVIEVETSGDLDNSSDSIEFYNELNQESAEYLVPLEILMDHSYFKSNELDKLAEKFKAFLTETSREQDELSDCTTNLLLPHYYEKYCIPNKAKKALSLANKKMSEQRRKIRALALKNRRLKKKLEDLMVSLNTSNDESVENVI